MAPTAPTATFPDPDTAAAPRALALTLTELARQSSARLSAAAYRSADTGRWCSPAAPHVPGCVCPPGGTAT